jgi:hypothetical protein
MRIFVIFLVLVLLLASCGGAGGFLNPGSDKTGMKAPSAVSATDGTLTDRVRITWVYPNTTVTPEGYRVMRYLTPTDPNPTQIGVVGNTNVFDDHFATKGVTYYYGVVSFKLGYTSSVISVLNSGFEG